MKLDEVDRRILRAWQANPGAPVVEIAEQVGLSHTPCWRRMKRLEESGVVRGRALLLEPGLVDLDVTVFAHLRLRQHDEATVEHLEQAACACPEIVECFSMSGESDFLLRIVVHSIGDYERFLKKTLLHLPGVASVNSSFALKCIKMTSDLPI
ncbi:Lrp/AsnC family transcriptional regulator [Sphingomonas sp. RT2P30]|uniref:Lrp/AsnC family transcriptional regulator n=1 Tax=Parasphingomonas halimpatiens TaxID=3096162 RepID=UPI002FC59FB8